MASQQMGHMATQQTEHMDTQQMEHMATQQTEHRDTQQTEHRDTQHAGHMDKPETERVVPASWSPEGRPCISRRTSTCASFHVSSAWHLDFGKACLLSCFFSKKNSQSCHWNNFKFQKSDCLQAEEEGEEGEGRGEGEGVGEGGR